MKPPRFAVTGTGRCGTGYAATVLRRSGVVCGHENWWTVVPKRLRSGLDGDSSWRACDPIERGEWSGPVVHIVRHPVGMVRSFMQLGYFPDNPAAVEREPDLADMPPLRAAVEWWVRWNRRCAAVAALTLQVESFVQRLDEVADVIGFRLNHGRAVAVPRNVNPKWNQRRPVEVDEAKVWRLLEGRAAEFGYRP